MRNDEASSKGDQEHQVQQVGKNEEESKLLHIWSCHSCSYQNPTTTTSRCEMCATPRLSANNAPISSILPNPQIIPAEAAEEGNGRGGGGGDKDEKEQEWPCPKCTFMNKMISTICAMCREGKQETKETTEHSSKAPSSKFWHCPQCTFTNALTSIRCEVCSFINKVVAEVDKNAAGGPLLLPVKQESEFMEALRAIDEIESNEQYRNILAYCQMNKQPFVDDSFPPTALSLRRSPPASTNSGNHPNYPNNLPRVEWRRPFRVRNFLRQHQQQPPWTVCNAPIPSDIVQGILGNCWFLSALAVASERRDILDRVLITKRISPEGVYQIRLCIDGHWRVVVVDDLFPCAPNGMMIYSKAKRNQLWVPLIEKALAKSYGSYEALTAGRTIEGLAILTGAPCEALHLPGRGRGRQEADADVVWAQLLSMKDAKFLMGASCGGDRENSATEYHLVGLEPLHAYSLLDVKEVNGMRLVKCRNPWGHFSWNGAWSEHSSLWTAQLRSELMPEGFRDGIFWMPYEDFCRYFDTVDVCRYRKNWRELRLAGLLPPHCRKNFVYVAELAASEATEIDIALYQPDTRNEKPTKHGVLDLAVMLFSVDDFGRPSGLVARSDHAVRAFVTLSTIVQPGQYLAVWVAFNHWGMRLLVDDEIPKCVLAVHSARGGLRGQVRSVNPVLLADCLVQMFLRDGTTTGTDVPGVQVYYLTNRWTGVAVMVANHNTDAVLNVHCDCSESRNAVSTRGSYVTVDTIPPGHRQIITVLTQVEGSSASSFSYRLQYTLLPTTTVRFQQRPYQDVIQYANKILSSFLGGNNGGANSNSNHHQENPASSSASGGSGSGSSNANNSAASHTPELDADVYGLHAPRPII